jgi:hypothetical protein
MHISRLPAVNPPRLQDMPTQNPSVHLTPRIYELLTKEAERRGVDPEVLVDELLQIELGSTDAEWDEALADLASLRAVLPNLDSVVEARASRDELEQRRA